MRWAGLIAGVKREWDVITEEQPDRRIAWKATDGGHQRLVPVSPRLFATVAAYLSEERPADAATDVLFVMLKGPRRGERLSAEGLDEIFPAPAAGPGWPMPPAMICVTGRGLGPAPGDKGSNDDGRCASRTR